MPLIPPAELPTLYRDIMEGRRRLVYWGAGLDRALVHHWQSPLPVSYFVDSDGRKWSERHHGLACYSPGHFDHATPATLAVAVHYHLGASFQEVRRVMERVPDIPYFVPRPLAEVCAALAEQDGDRRLHRAVFDYAGLKQSGSMELLEPWGDSRATTQRLAGHLRARRRTTRDRRALLVIERLSVGGAERQICNLAAGLRRDGWNVTLVSQLEPPAEAAHYLAFLDAEGVRRRQAPAWVPAAKTHWGQSLAKIMDDEAAMLLWHMPAFLVPQILGLYRVFAEEQPDLVIGYLDRPNVIGGIAATMADVPSIMMSGRNLNPTHFPHFYGGQCDELRRLYHLLLSLPGIALSANAVIGAHSYAQWLDLPPAAVPVIANSVGEDALATASPAALTAIRQQWGLPPGRLLLGVFRLSPEKNPLLFIEVFARLRPDFPDLRAVICGDGELAGALRERIKMLGLDESVTLLAGVAEMPLIMQAATLLLHPSRAEGTPNAILEAQAAGLPVVCTATGGSEACLVPEARLHVHRQDDAEGLTASCRRLLSDGSERRRLGQLGKAHMRRHHSIARLTRDTLAILGEGKK